MSTDHNFGSERGTEADSNRGPSAYQPTALPLGQTGSQPMVGMVQYIALRPRKPEAALGRTAQDGHLDSHTAPEVCPLDCTLAAFNIH